MFKKHTFHKTQKNKQTCKLKNDRGSTAGAIKACTTSLIYMFLIAICQLKVLAFIFRYLQAMPSSIF